MERNRASSLWYILGADVEDTTVILNLFMKFMPLSLFIDFDDLRVVGFIFVLLVNN